MRRSAASIAFPEHEVTDADVIDFEFYHDEGYRYSSYTYEDPSFKVSVRLNGGWPRSYEDESARDFFIQLMNYEEG